MPDLQYLAHALRDAGRVELRALRDGRGRSGIFDAVAPLADAIDALAASDTVYTTLNAPRLVPATNAMTGRPLTDDDIGYIVRLPFDFDPTRPKASNSSDAELAEAEQRRDAFVAAMRIHGWPMPLLAVSGNGAHAVYRCRLPATDALREMLNSVYTTLRHDYSDDVVQFDSTVRNASRIWRIYGTLNRKAPAMADRPQRMATCRIPARWACLSPRALERFATICAKRRVLTVSTSPAARLGDFAGGAGDYRTLDAAAWFAAHGAYKRPLAGGKHAVVCPWHGEHSDPDANLTQQDTSTVLFPASSADRFPSFHCSHLHCTGRTIIDVIRLWGDADRYCARQHQRRMS